MIDWSRPLVAVNLAGGKNATAIVDRSYASKAGETPVCLSVNAWVGDADGGTWYFNDEGYALGGLTTEGYDGRYRLANQT